MIPHGRPRDALGIPCPPRLESIFRDREQAVYLAAETEYLRERIVRLCTKPALARVNYDQISRHFTAIRGLLLRGAPYLPCPCTDLLRCEVCGGRGWLTVDEYPHPTDENLNSDQKPLGGSGAIL